MTYAVIIIVLIVSISRLVLHPPQYSPCRKKASVDGKPAVGLRTALLTATDAEGKRKTKGVNQIADFAGVVNPAAARAARGAAGGYGTHVCMAG